MDPIISLLERDTEFPEDGQVFPLYNPKFELRYKNIVPISTKLQTTNNESLYGDKTKYINLLYMRELYGRMQNYSRARKLSNPFENISSRGFIDRAVLKLAAIDKLFSLLPRLDENIKSFNVSDLAGAPGAMLEYVLWRLYQRNVDVDVTTISLISPPGNAWELERSTLPGVRNSVRDKKVFFSLGKDDTGDLIVPENILAFANDTRKRGERDLVIADGGVDVDNDPENQEVKNALLILGEVICALHVLKIGGKFVLKLYDAYTKFTADILCLLFRHFERSTIIKPYTSRPANAERYFVGIRFLGLSISKSALENIFTVLRQKLPMSDAKEIISGFLPTQDRILTDYLCNMNDFHAENQIHYLGFALVVDKKLTDNPRVKPNYPISYVLSRTYDILDIPYIRLNPESVIPSSTCNELEIVSFIAHISKELSSAKKIQGNYLTDLFYWLRYFLSRGGSLVDVIGAASNIKDDIPSIAREWSSSEDIVCTSKSLKTKQSTPKRFIFLEALASISPKKTISLVCNALSYSLRVDGNNRTIIAKGQGGVNHFTPKIVSTTLTRLLTPIEKIRYMSKKAKELLENKPFFLERSFILLKRYESFNLLENAYIIKWPEEVQLELYATLLTTNSSNFYSPVADIESEFGALDIPLSDNEKDLPENMKIGVNLLYASDEALRRKLIEKSLKCLDNGCTVYVLSSSPLSSFEGDRFEAPLVIEDRDITNSVTGRKYEGRSWLYKL